jgi:SAM-dependent methyltransferase
VQRRLTENERRAMVALYEGRFKDHGVDIRTVGWPSQEQQRQRFKVLLRDVEVRGKSVLDVGCGFGDLVPFLEQIAGDDFRYVGIDIVPQLVAAGAAKYGARNRAFRTGDFLGMSDLERFDIVVMSGALNFRIADNLHYAHTMLRRLHDLSVEVTSVNFLSSYVDFQNPLHFHYVPEDMFRFARSLTRWVTLIHDYPLWEFTLQLRHEPKS